MTIVDFKKYQEEARKTSFCPEAYKIVYATMGIAGEAGELANKVKKIMRGDQNKDELIAGIKGEMGDILWYLAALADDLGVELADVASENIEKLQSRQQRNQLRGAGDQR